MTSLRRPAYLICNAAGPAKYEKAVNDHFSPKSALFDTVRESLRPRSGKPCLSRRCQWQPLRPCRSTHHRIVTRPAPDPPPRPADFWLVVQSDVAFLAALGVLGYCVYAFGFAAVACYYIIPYLIVNHNLVAITYLQHTDTYVPHYREGAFTSMRGKLSTVDRSFGIFDTLWHGITDTHVLHHIDHCIPHYHAKEATEAIKEVSGRPPRRPRQPPRQRLRPKARHPVPPLAASRPILPQRQHPLLDGHVPLHGQLPLRAGRGRLRLLGRPQERHQDRLGMRDSDAAPRTRI